MPEPEFSYSCRKKLLDDLRLGGVGPQTPREEQPKQGGNASLLMERYLYKQETSGDGDKAARSALLKSIKSAVNKAKKTYQHAFENRHANLKNSGALSIYFRAKDRLLVGLGSTSVLEAGVALDRLYGVPMIPASTIKGAVAAAYRDKYGIGGAYPYLFGSDDAMLDEVGEKLETSGALCFYDAWCDPNNLDVALSNDIMTPHHSKYYTSAGETPAAAFDDPTPISFLSVGKVKFEFFVSCEGEETQAKQWLDLIFDLMRTTFAARGLGAKKNAGYGVMEEAVEGISIAPKKPFRNGDSVIVYCFEAKKDKDKKGKDKGKVAGPVKYKGRFKILGHEEIDCQVEPKQEVTKEDETRKSKFDARVVNDSDLTLKEPRCTVTILKRLTGVTG